MRRTATDSGSVAAIRTQRAQGVPIWVPAPEKHPLAIWPTRNRRFMGENRKRLRTRIVVVFDPFENSVLLRSDSMYNEAVDLPRIDAAMVCPASYIIHIHQTPVATDIGGLPRRGLCVITIVNTINTYDSSPNIASCEPIRVIVQTELTSIDSLIIFLHRTHISDAHMCRSPVSWSSDTVPPHVLVFWPLSLARRPAVRVVGSRRRIPQLSPPHAGSQSHSFCFCEQTPL